MKPPFFVPTDTTTLPFLIAPATLTTCNAGENMHDVPGHERHLAEGRHDEFLVHEDVHVGPSRPSFVHDAVADPGERRFEGAQHRVEVRCLEDDLVLSPGIGSKRRRDSHEDAGTGEFFGRCAGRRSVLPDPPISACTKRLWPTSADRRALPQRVKLRNRCRGAMDSQEILALALHLANQSEVPADTTINVPARYVRKVLFGIDVDAADLLFAKEKGYDLVIAHHPTGGSAVLGLPEVFAKHASILTSHGVPKEAADAAVREMQEEREPRVHAENYDHLPSMARMIGIGLMCIHNPCDEIGRRLMDEALRAQLPEKPRVRDAVAVLESMPEFRSALTRIVVRMGTTDHPLGKWAVHHGAGTNGGVPVARAAFDHGIDTVFYIHIDAGALRRLWEAYGREGPRNLVVTGHVASDSIGINVLVRELRARGLRVDTYSGIVDV